MLRVGDPVAGSDQTGCRNRWPDEPSLSCGRPDPERGQAIPEGSSRAASGSVEARCDPRRDGWPARRTLSGSELSGRPPLRSAAAPGGW
jgi:hypothetical protein